MSPTQFTEPTLLIPRWLGVARDNVIAELSNCLENAGRIANAHAFTRDVLNHESFVSTVFDAVTFPLARGPAVKELFLAIGLSQQAFRWGTGKAPMVQTVVLFAVPPSAGQPHLSLVVTFSGFLKDERAFSALRRCTQPEEMFAALKQVRLRRTGPQLEVAHS